MIRFSRMIRNVILGYLRDHFRIMHDPLRCVHTFCRSLAMCVCVCTRDMQQLIFITKIGLIVRARSLNINKNEENNLKLPERIYTNLLMHNKIKQRNTRSQRRSRKQKKHSACFFHFLQFYFPLFLSVFLSSFPISRYLYKSPYNFRVVMGFDCVSFLIVHDSRRDKYTSSILTRVFFASALRAVMLSKLRV